MMLFSDSIIATFIESYIAIMGMVIFLDKRLWCTRIEAFLWRTKLRCSFFESILVIWCFFFELYLDSSRFFCSFVERFFVWVIVLLNTFVSAIFWGLTLSFMDKLVGKVKAMHSFLSFFSERIPLFDDFGDNFWLSHFGEHMLVFVVLLPWELAIDLIQDFWILLLWHGVIIGGA